MTSQGQRFRRRSLRRGYKVDEVDSFLDRVEATLNAERVEKPVRAQEVHDVVFRVRFGGYDEWQVDLHLDRVERQLADQEPEDEFAADRLAPPDRLTPERLADRMPLDRMPDRTASDRMAPDRTASDRMVSDRMAPDRTASDRMAPDRLSAPRDDRMPPPRDDRMPALPRDDRIPPPGSERPSIPGRPMRPGLTPPPGPSVPVAGYPPVRYDEPTYVGEQGFSGGYDRQGRGDMTTEMRMPDVGAPTSGGSMPPSEVQRIDQLRRTFQARRFGSGYDRGEVDRLFDGIVNAMSGRGPKPMNDSELDPQQFSLVPNGYFEHEVDQALREVRDIFRRR